MSPAPPFSMILQIQHTQPQKEEMSPSAILCICEGLGFIYTFQMSPAPPFSMILQIQHTQPQKEEMSPSAILCTCEGLGFIHTFQMSPAQGRSHKIWSGQVSGACVSTQQLGGSGGMPPPDNFWNLEAMRLLLRPFLGQNDASRRQSFTCMNIYPFCPLRHIALHGFGFPIVR